MKKFIKSLNLRLSDLLLFIGFIPFAIFLVFGQLFMQYTDPLEVALPLWAAIICFVIALGTWVYYLILEFKRGNNPKLVVSCLFLFLTLLNVIAIAVQPNVVSEDVTVRMVNELNTGLYPGIDVGSIVHIDVPISVTHKLFFIMDVILIGMFIYIGLFIFPKRFTGILFVKYLGYVVMVFVLSVIFVGYFMEYDLYVPFIKTLLGKIDADPSVYAVKSYILHRNAYGMVMMIGIIFAFINHSIEKKWYYYLLVAFFFINMIFSYCKTGLIISVLMIAFYVIYRLIVTYKENKKRNTVLFIFIGSLAIIAIGVVGISLLTKGQVLGFIYKLLKGAKDNGTMDMRSYIWDNSYQLLRNDWWLIGRGFGIYNVILLPMNTVNGDAVFPAHSAYVGLISEGGILFLIGYIALLVYFAYVVYKCSKQNLGLTISLTFGAVAFILYSTTEAIQYLVYVFMFPVMVLYHSSKKSETQKEAA
ncbi:MAG: O-antigen ligase family protein [Bacilli bacterium]|nr:O-antigen ligase family protein [Bacilli bacterium]